MSEIGIQISVPCGPEGAAILSALAKAFGAPNPDLTAAQDHLAHTATVNTHMLPQQPPVTPLPVTPSAQAATVGQAVAQGFQQAAPVTPPVPSTPPIAPQPAGIPTAAPDYTHEQLGRAAAAHIDKSPANMAQLRGLLQQFGVQAITQLATPEARTAFAAALRGLGVQV